MKLKELLKFVSAPEYIPAPPCPKGIRTDKQWSVSYRIETFSCGQWRVIREDATYSDLYLEYENIISEDSTSLSRLVEIVRNVLTQSPE